MSVLSCNLTVKQFIQSYFYNQSYPFAYQSTKNIHIKNKPGSRPISYKIYITYRIVKTIIEINTPISANTL